MEMDGTGYGTTQLNAGGIRWNSTNSPTICPANPRGCYWPGTVPSNPNGPLGEGGVYNFPGDPSAAYHDYGLLISPTTSTS